MHKETRDAILKLLEKEYNAISQKPALDVSMANFLGALVDIEKDICEIRAMENSGYGAHDSYTMPSYYNRMVPMNSYDRGWLLQPYEQRYSRNASEQDMINYLRSAAENMPQPKRDMIHDFVMRLEQM